MGIEKLVLTRTKDTCCDDLLKGNHYSAFTPALTQDRENCMAAIWRFNNATNASHSASIEECQRRLEEIIVCLWNASVC